MNLFRITEFRANWFSAVKGLLPQLTDSETGFNEDFFAHLVQLPDTFLLAAEEDERILGILTLTLYRIPTGVQARIDDVVVDKAARKRGIGRALMEEALRICTRHKVGAVHLTSHPRRTAANRLYQTLGFEPYQTNVYVKRL